MPYPLEIGDRVFFCVKMWINRFSLKSFCNIMKEMVLQRRREMTREEFWGFLDKNTLFMKDKKFTCKITQNDKTALEEIEHSSFDKSCAILYNVGKQYNQVDEYPKEFIQAIYFVIFREMMKTMLLKNKKEDSEDFAEIEIHENIRLAVASKVYKAMGTGIVPSQQNSSNDNTKNYMKIQERLGIRPLHDFMWAYYKPVGFHSEGGRKFFDEFVSSIATGIEYPMIVDLSAENSVLESLFFTKTEVMLCKDSDASLFYNTVKHHHEKFVDCLKKEVESLYKKRIIIESSRVRYEFKVEELTVGNKKVSENNELRKAVYDKIQLHRDKTFKGELESKRQKCVDWDIAEERHAMLKSFKTCEDVVNNNMDKKLYFSYPLKLEDEQSSIQVKRAVKYFLSHYKFYKIGMRELTEEEKKKLTETEKEDLNREKGKILKFHKDVACKHNNKILDEMKGIVSNLSKRLKNVHIVFDKPARFLRSLGQGNQYVIQPYDMCSKSKKNNVKLVKLPLEHYERMSDKKRRKKEEKLNEDKNLSGYADKRRKMGIIFYDATIYKDIEDLVSVTSYLSKNECDWFVVSDKENKLFETVMDSEKSYYKLYLQHISYFTDIKALEELFYSVFGRVLYTNIPVSKNDIEVERLILENQGFNTVCNRDEDYWFLKSHQEDKDIVKEDYRFHRDSLLDKLVVIEKIEPRNQ